MGQMLELCFISCTFTRAVRLSEGHKQNKGSDGFSAFENTTLDKHVWPVQCFRGKCPQKKLLQVLLLRGELQGAARESRCFLTSELLTSIKNNIR